MKIMNKYYPTKQKLNMPRNSNLSSSVLIQKNKLASFE